MSTEPSKEARDAAKNFELDHYGDWPGDDVAAIKFQQVITAACAERDREIASLRQELQSAGDCVKQRIAELEAELVESNRLLSADAKQIFQLGERLAALTALISKCPTCSAAIKEQHDA